MSLVNEPCPGCFPLFSHGTARKGPCPGPSLPLGAWSWSGATWRRALVPCTAPDVPRGTGTAPSPRGAPGAAAQRGQAQHLLLMSPAASPATLRCDKCHQRGQRHQCHHHGDEDAAEEPVGGDEASWPRGVPSPAAGPGSHQGATRCHRSPWERMCVLAELTPKPFWAAWIVPKGWLYVPTGWMYVPISLKDGWMSPWGGCTSPCPHGVAACHRGVAVCPYIPKGWLYVPISPTGGCMSPQGVRMSPQGVCMSPWGGCMSPYP